MASTENARGQETLFSYDDLNRPTLVNRPLDEEDVTITYRPTEAQQESVSTPTGYGQTFTYDCMGRLLRKQLDVTGLVSKSFLIDREYDELGRETVITYPDTATIVRYEYAGAYLKKVCEVPSEQDDCSHANAIPYISDVVYDALGRREKVIDPTGERTLAYSAETHRVLADSFVGPGYSRSLAYAPDPGAGAGTDFYDEIGNLTAIQASSSTSAIDFSATYSYDTRNRLATWTPGTELTQYFSYDNLGNLKGPWRSHGRSSEPALRRSDPAPRHLEQHRRQAVRLRRRRQPRDGP